MSLALMPTSPLLVNDTDYRGTDWQVSKVKWALDQWRWSAAQATDWHVFMTDDLHIAPRFWEILEAMTAHARVPIGLLSNHPEAIRLWSAGAKWYRTNSWIVGPCYALPHAFMVSFLEWFEAKPEGGAHGAKGYANDDSSINEYVTHSGAHALHPLPTIVEHRNDIGSTVGHGDRFSCERVSWRAIRWPEGDPIVWRSTMSPNDIDAMARPEFWEGAKDAPLLKVGA